MSVHALDFGTTHTGQPTHLYRMRNSNGMEVDVTDLGASIVAVRVPLRDGTLVDVALGYDEVEQYEHNQGALGGVVGRCANRIAGAEFELDGFVHHLVANEGPNTLHGGCDMWYERLWEGAMVGRKGDRRRASGANTVIFGLVSPDGDQGFPGELDVRVTYTLSDDNELSITYDAQPSVTTVVNLTNHVYWNLNGHDSGSIVDHVLHIAAERYTPTAKGNVPDGRRVNVGGTPFDFRLAKPIGRDFTTGFVGYDHNFLLGDGSSLKHVATLVGDKTGIRLDVLTDLPAMQVYTGHHLANDHAKDDASYGPFAGVALETQYVPDAIHHEAFKQPVFSPEDPFHSRTVFALSA